MSIPRIYIRSTSIMNTFYTYLLPGCANSITSPQVTLTEVPEPKNDPTASPHPRNLDQLTLRLRDLSILASSTPRGPRHT